MKRRYLPCEPEGHCVGSYCSYEQECDDENWFTNPEYIKEKKE